MQEKLRMILTSDGSHTLYNAALNESYHSRHGAIQESEHIFIQNGLDSIKTEPVNLLEIGFGTGLNAFLTCLYSIKNNRNIHYEALELFPLDMRFIRKLNYTSKLDSSKKNIFLKLHDSDWNKETMILPTFKILKLYQDFITFLPEKKYHLVYFDAFSPEKQPNMWQAASLNKLHDALEPNGVMVTYCAKGDIRRRLEKIGFQVERLPGPPGKLEMLRALKIPG